MAGIDFLNTLEGIIQNRLDDPPPDSYTARIAAGGNLLAAKKLAEEAAEAALAAVAESPARLTEESADLLYHLLVLLRMRALSLETVVAELRRRHRTVS
ncbi:MAG: phosphoribosyl-ATP diphosphatase [Rhodospirillaceae bacterium]|nr:phosphoribosyl-ATP diphosphatase [Rhodospirillaceae bacterium]